jgi:spermidine synthase
MPTTLTLIFFLSGVAALVFEALWFRLAGLSLGNSVWSATVVLSAFMAGLTLGNALIARLHRRVTRPVRLYAWLELAIGVGGVGAVLLLPELAHAFRALFSALADAPWLLNGVRLGTAFVILVIPATAMGATLPVLTEALSRADPNFAANIGRLYGWNTLGAMLGAIATEAFLVRSFGVLGSGLFAASLNLIAAAIGLRLANAHEPRAAPAIAAEQRRALSLNGYRYLIVGFLSGAVMLALEVVWFRFLLLSYDGTSLIFAVMLAVVLAGIALGALAAGRLARRDERSHRWLRHVSALSAVFVVMTYGGFDLFTVHQILHRTTALEFVGLAAFLMLPVAVLSGAAFTMVGRGVEDELGSPLRSAGVATLWNTVGATLGSLCAGFVLLPLLGMELSLFVLAGVYAVTALLAPADGVAENACVRRVGHSAVALAAACLIFFPFGLMQRSFFVIVQRALPDQTLVATREGLTETVRYYRRDVFGAPHFYRLVTDGYSMSANTIPAKRYMKLYVYLPLALHADARDALLISFGVGSTAKALTDSAGLRHIDVVDISRDILEMSSVIYPDAENPLRDERVRVHVEDGRFFLNTSSRKYDLITSEPPPPKIAGVVNLYSQEYFELIREHLNEGGYATYWLPAHQLEPLDALVIIKAFCNAFDDCSLWSGGGLEWMLMGSRGEPARVPAQAFARQWRDSKVGPELVSLGFEAPEQLGSLFMGDARLLKALTESVPPLTDNRPLRLSDKLIREQGREPLYEMLMDETERLERFETSDLIARLWPAELKTASAAFFRYERFIKNHLTEDRYRIANDPFLWEAIDDVLTNSHLETLPLWLLGTDAVAQRVAEELAAGGESAPKLELELALGDVSRRDYAAALARVRRHVAVDPDGVSVGEMSLLLYLLAKNDLVEEVRAVIDGLDGREAQELRSFIDWFDSKFGHRVETSSTPAADSPARR